MHVHLENMVMKKGVISRESFYIGSMTPEDVSKLPNAIKWEREQLGGNDGVMTWYVVSLEDHERGSIESEKSKDIQP